MNKFIFQRVVLKKGFEIDIGVMSLVWNVLGYHCLQGVRHYEKSIIGETHADK